MNQNLLQNVLKINMFKYVLYIVFGLKFLILNNIIKNVIIMMRFYLCPCSRETRGE